MAAGIQKLFDRLNAFSNLQYMLLLLVYYLVSAAGFLSHYDFNPGALVRFGHYYIEQNQELTPEGTVRFIGNEEHGGNGYDGQIFYYYARSLFLKDVWPEGFNNAYRAPRVGYPFLSGIFSVWGSRGTLFGMIFTQMYLSLFSLWALLKILPEQKRFLSLFYIFSPFSLQSFTVLVSDSVMVSLVVIGYYFYRKIRDEFSSFTINDAMALFSFSLAVLTKESSLFFLFPLGLSALIGKKIKKIVWMLLILLPMAAWQIYLREAHGMLPAGVLAIFLSPLDGILGLAVSTVEMQAEFYKNPNVSGFLLVLKHSVKWLLVFLILFSFRSIFDFSNGLRNENFPFRLAIFLTLLSVLIADYYYFWGIYENISRMFTILVPLMVLYAANENFHKSRLFFITLAVLSGIIFLRTVFLAPSFPYDVYRSYSGKSHADHAPVPVNR